MATERVTVSEVESVIRQLRDVIGVRVVSDPGGVIQEIHVLTHAERVPKQVVRDVESALQARLGITLDHKKVSVAQVQSGQQAPATRIHFNDVSISLTGQSVEATVRLSREGAIYTGQATGSSSTGGQIKTVASAALKALTESMSAPQVMLIEDAAICTVGGHQVVTVVVTIGGDRSDEVVCGSCVVRQDIVKAGVFATLDAMNRRISRIS